MPKQETVSAPAELESSTPPKKQPFDVFERAKLVPAEITCQAYKPYHWSDDSCHSNLRFDAAQIAQHVRADHSGGFQLKFRVDQTGRSLVDKPWTGWKDLNATGLQIHDFRCGVCERSVPLTVRHIQEHSKPHKGSFRGSGQFAGSFNITLKFEDPLASGDDAFDTE